MLVRSTILAVLVLAIGGLLTTSALRAGDETTAVETVPPPPGRTPVPVPAKGKGDQCVAPTDWMRRNHMTMLKHQRNTTVHEGDRTGRFSIKACVECHAVKGVDGKAVTVTDPKHFCRTCHDYAAVSIDCFECHASRPQEPGKVANFRGSPEDLAALTRYVEGLGK